MTSDALLQQLLGILASSQFSISPCDDKGCFVARSQAFTFWFQPEYDGKPFIRVWVPVVTEIPGVNREVAEELADKKGWVVVESPGQHIQLHAECVVSDPVERKELACILSDLAQRAASPSPDEVTALGGATPAQIVQAPRASDQLDVWPVACGYQRSQRHDDKCRTAVDLAIIHVKGREEITWWPVPAGAKAGDVLLFRLREHLREFPASDADEGKRKETASKLGTFDYGETTPSPVFPAILGGQSPNSPTWVCGDRGYHGLALVVDSQPPGSSSGPEREASISNVVLFKRPFEQLSYSQADAWMPAYQAALIAGRQATSFLNQLLIFNESEWQTGKARTTLEALGENVLVDKLVSKRPLRDGAALIEILRYRREADDQQELADLLDRAQMLRAGMTPTLTGEIVSSPWDKQLSF